MAQQTVGARGVSRAVGVAAAVVVATVGVGAPVARGADTAWTQGGLRYDGRHQRPGTGGS